MLERTIEQITAELRKQPIERFVTIDHKLADSENRTVDLAIASDKPVDEWFGQLELSMDEKAVRTQRIKEIGIPLLMGHDHTKQVGIIDNYKIGRDGVLRGTARFDEHQLAQDAFRSVQNGFLRGVSAGFMIHKVDLKSSGENSPDIYRSEDWEPIEASLTPIPKDISVGIGRTLDIPPEQIQTPPSPESRELPIQLENKMKDKDGNEIPTPAPDPVVERILSPDELNTEEITRWGVNLGCPELAKRYLTETFADEKDITVRAFQQFVKANQAETVKVPPIIPGRVNDRSAVISLGEAFINSDAYKRIVGKSRGPNTRLVTEVPLMPSSLGRATFDTTSTGLQGYIDYQHGPILIPNERLTVRDLLAGGQTNLNAVPYIQETSYTNAATTVAEEGEKPEATLALQDEFAYVKKIAVMKRVTSEMYDDFTSLRDFINNRLRFMVKEREEMQLLSGAGTGSEITGIMTASIQSQAKAGDTVVDAIHKAITKIRINNRTEPDGIVINPLDWEPVRLSKDDNLNYYGGGPFGTLEGDTLWGKRVVVTSNIPENTALVGSFKIGAQIFDREGITVESTNSHEDDFAFNRMAILVEERLALAIWQVNAFCKVTGI